MTDAKSQSRRAETLAEFLEHNGPLELDDVLAIIRPVATQVAAMHQAGSLHLAISVDTVSFDSDHRALLSTEDLADYRRQSELVPPELHAISISELPAETDRLESFLADQGIHESACRIDVYQLGDLLCRLVANESGTAYLRSAKVKGRCPQVLQPVLDRALGGSLDDRFSSVAELVTALDTAAGNGDARQTEKAAADTKPAPKTTPAPKSKLEKDADEGATAGDSLQKLGHYQIIRRIGQGGMGDVYLASDNTLNRTVAIKVLPAEFSRESDFVSRFQAEAMAAAQLTHPNIVPIHAIGEEDGRHFFVMQYVVGRSLADRLDVDKSIPLDETIAILDQVVSGLATAHRSGLIHRDIKPGNVLLDEEHDRALLADFGLVKSIDSIGQNTATGVILGTVDYMSPEQGRGPEVDQRSDLYSVGVMIYRMLAGCLPFEAESPTAMVFQHVYETPPELRSVAPEVPLEVSDLVSKLVAKDPGERFQSADELLIELRSLRRTLGLLDATQVVSLSGQTMSPVGTGTSSTDELLGQRRSLKERVALLFKRQAPAIADHLLNTQQNVDLAVNDYRERCVQLECLVADAEYVHEDLVNQAKQQRESAAQWSHRAKQESQESERESALKEQRFCEEIAEDLEAQAATQQDELESMRLQFANAKATLLKLSNQRDLLSARLRAAQSTLDDSPSTRFWSPPRIAIASVLAVILCCAGLYIFQWANADTGGDNDVVGKSSQETAPSRSSANRGATSTASGSAASGLGPPDMVSSIGLELMRIGAGEFLMGSPPYEQKRMSVESIHPEVIEKPFFIGRYEITMEEYVRVFQGLGAANAMPDAARRLPVANLTWHQAVQFCTKLTEVETEADGIYRLPTEAEWEYACRAGTVSAFFWGNDASSDQMNFDGRHPYGKAKSGVFLGRPVEVGSYAPNSFGLYDMHGNVWEWCSDWYGPYGETNTGDGTLKVSRGGCYKNGSNACRSANRNSHVPEFESPAVGFRVVFEPNQ